MITQSDCSCFDKNRFKYIGLGLYAVLLSSTSPPWMSVSHTWYSFFLVLSFLCSCNTSEGANLSLNLNLFHLLLLFLVSSVLLCFSYALDTHTPGAFDHLSSVLYIVIYQFFGASFHFVF